MIESKGDSLTQRQREYIEMLDRVYDLKTINKTESFFGGIVRTMGFVASTFKNQKSVSYVPDLPIIKMCMEFVYIRNNKHEYDEFSEMFDELPVSRKEFKNICSEIDKGRLKGSATKVYMEISKYYRGNDFPGSASAFSRKLTQEKQAINDMGFEFQIDRTKSGADIIIKKK